MAAPINTVFTLLDQDTNCEVYLLLSAEDAKKAENDDHYAYQLLQAAKAQEANCESVPTETCNEGGSEKGEAAAVEESEKENQKDQYVWTRRETLLLIQIYKDNIEDFDKKKMTAKKRWQLLTDKLAAEGYTIPWEKVKTKIQSLTRTYKAINDHNKKSGNDRKTWEYYEHMNDIHGSKPWIDPLATASSNPVEETKTEEEGKKRKIIEQRSEAPKKKKDLLQVLEDSVREKTEARKDANKRHSERMAMLASLKDLLKPPTEKP